MKHLHTMVIAFGIFCTLSPLVAQTNTPVGANASAPAGTGTNTAIVPVQRPEAAARQ